MPLLDLILPLLVQVLEEFVIPMLEFFAEILTAVVIPVVEWLAGLIESVLIGAVDLLVIAFEKLVDFFGTVKEVFEDVWNGISDFFKGAINGLLGMIEGLANGMIDVINSVIRAINSVKIDVPQWVTDLTGITDFGFNLPTLSKIRLPRLAEGGFVDSPTMALIGEAGPEVVTPLRDFERMMGLTESGSGMTLNYNAAPNQSLSSEQALIEAIRKARLVFNWSI